MLPERAGEYEVSLEWFSRLKEYDSLLKARNGHLSAVKEQEGRLSALSSKRDERMAQLTTFKEDHVRLQQKLLEIESRIQLLSRQRENWISLGGEDDKRLSMEAEISALEDSGLQLLDEQHQNAREREDAQTFIDGITKTITEIGSEVAAEVSSHQSSVSQLDLRLESVRELLPDEFRSTLDKVLKKNPAHGPFTRIEAGSCFFCRYKISRMDESEIDMQKKLKTCPQCGRIFIPYGT